MSGARKQGRRVPRWALRAAAERLTRARGWWSSRELASEVGCDPRTVLNFVTSHTKSIQAKGKTSSRRYAVRSCTLLTGWSEVSKRAESGGEDTP